MSTVLLCNRLYFKWWTSISEFISFLFQCRVYDDYYTSERVWAFYWFKFSSLVFFKLKKLWKISSCHNVYKAQEQFWLFNQARLNSLIWVKYRRAPRVTITIGQLPMILPVNLIQFFLNIMFQHSFGWMEGCTCNSFTST